MFNPLVKHNISVFSDQNGIVLEDLHENYLIINQTKDGIFVKVRGKVHVEFLDGIDVYSAKDIDVTTTKSNVHIDTVSGEIHLNSRRTERVRDLSLSKEYLDNIEKQQKEHRQIVQEEWDKTYQRLVSVIESFNGRIKFLEDQLKEKSCLPSTE